MINSTKWGEYQGKDIFHYTFENSKGMRVGLTNLGCAVTSILFNGIDVALGFDSPEGYIEQTGFIGVVAGRCANRIKDGLFELDGKQCRLGKNDGNNHLHGGFKGFDKAVWDVDSEDSAENRVCFSYFSRDGEEGYPGNLTIKVTYTLEEDCGLRIDYEASTDQATVINLTNHSYFNLSGHNSGSIENHQIRICSDHFLETDGENIPTGKAIPVAGTPFDFREFQRIGERIDCGDIQLQYGGGYDHNWNLDQEETEGLRLAAEALDKDKSIRMQVYTTKPGIQFYSGNSLAEKNPGKDGAVYGWRNGFCLETQNWPDAIHHPGFPSPVLLPDQMYRHTTIYRFIEN